jgi:hypothetical protein
MSEKRKLIAIYVSLLLVIAILGAILLQRPHPDHEPCKLDPVSLALKVPVCAKEENNK